MDIDYILADWNLNLKLNDDDIIEILSNEFPEKCFLIDMFPLRIKSFEKYQYVELYFDNETKNEFYWEKFENEEKKFIEFITKLWLYNNTKVKTNLLDLSEKKFISILKSKNISTFSNIKNRILNSKNTLVELNDLNELILLVKLGFREKVYSELILLDYKVLIRLYENSFFIYLNDLNFLPLIKTIATTEGIYLREF